MPKAEAGVTANKVQVHGQDSTAETNMRLDYHDYTDYAGLRGHQREQAWRTDRIENLTREIGWCRNADSNCGPTDYESVALPN